MSLPCAGAIVEVDLTEGRISRRATPEDLIEGFLGGRGLGARLLWDLPAGTPADAPETPLIFCPGLLSAYPVPAKPRTTIVTKSAVTRPVRPRFDASAGVTYSNAGGFLGPELKRAGVDALVIKGRSSRPTLLVLDGAEVRLEDASDLWGMTVPETEDALVRRLGPDRFQSAYIGPAGESGVRFASVMHDRTHAFGRGGPGFVMGSKRLKAISVRGDRMPDVADYAEYRTMVEALRGDFRSQEGSRPYRDRRRYGTFASLRWVGTLGGLAVRNYREGAWGEFVRYHRRAERLFVHHNSCFACPVACRKSAVVDDGPLPGVYQDVAHFEHAAMLGANCGISDAGIVAALSEQCNDLGLDAITAGNILGFLMDAQERRLLPERFLEGSSMEWADHEGMIELLDKIAHGRGVGELLGRGLPAIVEELGPRAEPIAYHAKGMEYAAWNPKGVAPMGLSYLTSTRGACHLFGQVPGGQNSQAMLDSAGDCLLVRNFTARASLARLVSAVVGRSYSAGELFRLGERVINLEKCFNWREGFERRDDEHFPAGLSRNPVSPAQEPFSRSWLETALAGYYRRRGWNLSTSKPERSTLERLDLAFAADEIG